MSTGHVSRFFILLGVLWLVACGSDIDEAVIRERVVAAVRATITTVALSTAAPTYTLYPTLTAVATLTPAPTYTNQPSLTPQATYTAHPTLTSLPTAAPSDTPLPTATTAPIAAAPTASVVDRGAEVLLKIETVLVTVNLYIATIDPRVQTLPTLTYRQDPTDCQRLVSLHETVANLLLITDPINDPAVESAYNRYLISVDTILARMNPWTDSCRDSLANGEATKFLGQNAVTALILECAEPIAVLNQAANDLQALGY